jgi:hypothetical protein
MSQQVVNQYVHWVVRHVRDEALKRIGNQLRANYVTDPNDPLHRGPYHHLLRAGVPEAAIPAVLRTIIHSVEVALELALWQQDQLWTTGHLRVSLLEPAAGDKPEDWVELSSGDHLTWENFIPFAEESAGIRTAEELDAFVRGPGPSGGEWKCPVGGCANCSQAERVGDVEP